MEKGEFIYEGKAKKVYRTDNPDYYIVSYKDDTRPPRDPRVYRGLKTCHTG
ncbi:phosphoribosylaminoimidazolesuccinocarboxamide synthase [Desulforudis sp. DRI-14]|uniref:phosphoribosylaminoimidazolesuccinocarboxamide synthase n=1 Tax=Desulforudis sp. DRI-14 TaxID=3459793 RepID=UPI003BCBFBED